MICIDRTKCDFCGTCVAVCPVDAIQVLEAEVIIDDEVCTHCLSCVAACPCDAWGLVDGKAHQVGVWFGCGLCLVACPEGAIEMELRREV